MAEVEPRERAPLTLAVAVLFLNEEELLPTLLDSIAKQSRRPDRLLLVDDGSDDGSPEIAQRFAREHPYATVLRRPQQTREADRLAAAAELVAFQWAAEQLPERFDVIAKLDGDLELTPRFFESIVSALENDPGLGIAGAALSVATPGGGSAPENSARWHVRGATKFYRRECWEQISPLPTILGWDTIDEARARLRGWRVEPVAVEGGDALHLRPTGSYDGAMRGFRRRGVAAWAYGAHPLGVLGSAVIRMREQPRVLGGLAYAQGWLGAAKRRDPRAEPEVLRFVRREQLQRIGRRVARGARG
jgi:biofilm PGA synthesis N-glycosyltransferase PgaC